MNWGQYDSQMKRLTEADRREAIRLAERLVEQSGLAPDDAVWAALFHHAPASERDLLLLQRLQPASAEDPFELPARPHLGSTWDD